MSMRLRHLIPCSLYIVSFIMGPAVHANVEDGTPVPRYTIEGQRLAVPEVCAWPKLTRLRDGTIIAAIYDRPSHGQLPGDVACWASTDGGRTWEHRGNATSHRGNSAWLNHALGVAGNGDLLVVTSGWNFQEAGGKGAQNVPLVPIVTRSTDGGRTWKTVARFPQSPEAGKQFVPFGNIDRGEDGHLRVAVYAYARGLPPPREDTGYVVSSEDDGATWKITATIGTPAVNETDLFYAGGDRWLAAARNLGSQGKGHSIDLHVSEDNARTWRKIGQVTKPSGHPGDLLRLADGRIVLTYGDRTGPDFGVNARVSGDGGETWSSEFRIASGFESRDSGYPSSVQLDDGTIVTAYYARGSKEYAGYQMGVVRWRLR